MTSGRRPAVSSGSFDPADQQYPQSEPAGQPGASGGGAGPYDQPGQGPHGAGPYDQPGPPYGQGPYGQGPYGQGPYGQGPYVQGPYGPGWQQPRRTNSLAIAALCCAIGQVVAGPLAGIPAIVIGVMSLGQIRQTGEDGRGMAITGIVLGIAGVLLAVLVVIFALAVFAHIQSSSLGPGSLLPRPA
jgi:Domain of unknown function (DUF4190)